MKKILIFSTAYLPLIGGAEIAVKEITDRLDDWEFDLICARIDGKLPKREKIGNVNIYRIGFGCFCDKIIWLPLAGFWAGFLNLFNKKYSAIWAIMASQGGLAALFFKLLNPRVPFLLTLQEGDDLKYILRKMKPFFLFKLIFQKADYIQAISNYLAEWGKEMGARCPIEVIPNGVNVEIYKNQSVIPVKTGIQVLDPRLRGDDKENNQRIIITTSRLVVKNGVGDLIETMNFLKDKPYKLLILGSGPLEESLKFKVKSLKLEDIILFLGTIKPEEIPRYLSIADVFVRPSLSEGLGNSFLEAMAAGVPIIGTPVGGIPDFLINNETGLFCEVNNPRSIAEKINLLLSDENLRQKLIINGRKLVKEKYDWDIIAGAIKEIFDKYL